MLHKQPRELGGQNLEPRLPDYFWRYKKGWCGSAASIEITENKAVHFYDSQRKQSSFNRVRWIFSATTIVTFCKDETWIPTNMTSTDPVPTGIPAELLSSFAYPVSCNEALFLKAEANSIIDGKSDDRSVDMTSTSTSSFISSVLNDSTVSRRSRRLAAQESLAFNDVHSLKQSPLTGKEKVADFETEHNSWIPKRAFVPVECSEL